MSTPQPDGFLALPPNMSGKPVLVLHPWWGLNETIKSTCTRLANAGFVAFAPDLYHGKVAATIPDAETFSSALFDDLDRPRADVASAAAFLKSHPAAAAPQLALIGFSLGAFFALDLSVADPEAVRSVVLFYGTRPGDYTGAKAAYLGHYAESDDFEPQSEVDNLQAALKDEGCEVTFHTYPGTGHWFFEPDRADAYNPAAASLAWDRTLAFLNR